MNLHYCHLTDIGDSTSVVAKCWLFRQVDKTVFWRRIPAPEAGDGYESASKTEIFLQIGAGNCDDFYACEIDDVPLVKKIYPAKRSIDGIVELAQKYSIIGIETFCNSKRHCDYYYSLLPDLVYAKVYSIFQHNIQLKPNITILDLGADTIKDYDMIRILDMLPHLQDLSLGFYQTWKPRARRRIFSHAVMHQLSRLKLYIWGYTRDAMFWMEFLTETQHLKYLDYPLKDNTQLESLFAIHGLECLVLYCDGFCLLRGLGYLYRGSYQVAKTNIKTLIIRATYKDAFSLLTEMFTQGLAPSIRQLILDGTNANYTLDLAAAKFLMESHLVMLSAPGLKISPEASEYLSEILTNRSFETFCCGAMAMLRIQALDKIMRFCPQVLMYEYDDVAKRNFFQHKRYGSLRMIAVKSYVATHRINMIKLRDLIPEELCHLIGNYRYRC